MPAVDVKSNDGTELQGAVDPLVNALVASHDDSVIVDDGCVCDPAFQEKVKDMFEDGNKFNDLTPLKESSSNKKVSPPKSDTVENFTNAISEGTDILNSGIGLPSSVELGSYTRKTSGVFTFFVS